MGHTPHSLTVSAWVGGDRRLDLLQLCREVRSRRQGDKGLAVGCYPSLQPVSTPPLTWKAPPYLFFPLALPVARGVLFSDLVSSTILQDGVCLLMAMGLLTVSSLLTTMGLLTVTGFETGTGFVTVTSFVIGTGLFVVTGLVSGTGLLIGTALVTGTDLVTGMGLVTGTALVTGTGLVTGTALVIGMGLLTVTGLVTGTGLLTVTGLLIPMGLLTPTGLPIVTGLLTPMGLLTPTGRLMVTGRLTGPGLGADRGRSMWFQIRCFSSWVLEVKVASQKGQGKVRLSEMAPWVERAGVGWAAQASVQTYPSQQLGRVGSGRLFPSPQPLTPWHRW